jgi:hypothetical protein
MTEPVLRHTLGGLAAKCLLSAMVCRWGFRLQGHGGICVREGDDNQLDRVASALQAFSNVSDHARVAALTATHH